MSDYGVLSKSGQRRKEYFRNTGETVLAAKMKEESDFRVSAPEGWEQGRSEQAEPEKKKRAAWIEPVVLFAIALAIQIGGRVVIEATRGQTGPGSGWLVDLSSGGLAL